MSIDDNIKLLCLVTLISIYVNVAFIHYIFFYKIKTISLKYRPVHWTIKKQVGLIFYSSLSNRIGSANLNIPGQTGWFDPFDNSTCEICYLRDFDVCTFDLSFERGKNNFRSVRSMLNDFKMFDFY